MFGVVRQWWEEKDESEREFLRHALSREGVEQGRNHKEGQHDSGHGCGKPIHRVKPKKDGGEFGVAQDMGKAVGSALEEAFLSGGQGGGSNSGFGGLLGGIAGAAFGGYMANQMGGGGGGEESRSSGFEEVRERGFGGSGGQERGIERGVERSYEQVGGEGRYEERIYERPVAHGDTAAYLRNHSYTSGEGRGYYGADPVERNESYVTPGYERNVSHDTSGYGGTDPTRSIPGAFGEHESYGGEGYSHHSSQHSQSRHISESHHVSHTSHVSHHSTSYGKYSSHETRVEHHGSGGSGGSHERREKKVYREFPAMNKDVILKFVISSTILGKRGLSIGGIINLDLKTRRQGIGGGTLGMKMRKKTNTRGRRGKRKKERGERRSTPGVKVGVETSIMAAGMSVLGIGVTKFRIIAKLPTINKRRSGL